MNKGDDDQNQGRQTCKFPWVGFCMLPSYSRTVSASNRIMNQSRPHPSSGGGPKAGKFVGLPALGLPHVPHHARVNAKPLDSTRRTHQPECATKEYQESLVNVCGILIYNCGINSR